MNRTAFAINRPTSILERIRHPSEFDESMFEETAT